MISMLEEYSKGKVLTILTNKVKKVKKSKRKQNKTEVYGEVDLGEVERAKALNEEDLDEDYNPNKGEDIDK